MRTYQYVMRGISSLALAGLLLGAYGCATNDRHFRDGSQYESDLRLAQRIQETLETAPVYKYPDVNVSVYRGRVQLSGFVATEGQRESAEALVERVPGVARVENNLLLKEVPGSAMGGWRY